jgi:multicomponent Na+:H+ antiporter subunit D
VSADWIAPLVILVPFAGAVAGFAAGARGSQAIGIVTSLLTAGAVGALAWAVAATGPGTHAIGGWEPPLGIALRADGLAVAFLSVTSAVGLAVGLYAMRSFPATPPGVWAGRVSFWPLWLGLWASMNALYLAGDTFNAYVCLELITLGGVALVMLSGAPRALAAGLRYLLAAFFGSLAYLTGIAIAYALAGALDMLLVAERLASDAAGVPVVAALGLMTAGVAVKAALFPLHFWLPDAHSRAPAAGSAILSGLVVTAGLYLLLRLWFTVAPAWVTGDWSLLLGLAGAAALIVGSYRAVRSSRLKLLLAHSTVAQVGLVVLAVPIGLGWHPSDPAAGVALEAQSGGVTLAVAHGLAKAALFLAAGALVHAAGTDELRELRGVGRRMPLVVAAMVLAGASLTGLPWTGGYAGKHLLLHAAEVGGQWWWWLALWLSLPLTAAYVLLLLWRAVAASPAGRSRHSEPVPLTMQLAPLVLALAAAGLGLGPAAWQPLLDVEAGEAPGTAAVGFEASGVRLPELPGLEVTP